MKIAIGDIISTHFEALNQHDIPRRGTKSAEFPFTFTIPPTSRPRFRMADAFPSASTEDIYADLVSSMATSTIVT